MAIANIFAFVAVFVAASYSRLFAAGSNDDGLLGVGKSSAELANSSKFIELKESPFFSTSSISKIGLGKDHVIILTKYTEKDVPSIVVWGDNTFGQLGVLVDANSKNSNTPTRLSFNVVLDEGDYVVDVAAGGSHNLLLTKNGRVFSYGNAAGGRLGLGAVSNSRPGCGVNFSFIRYCYTPQEITVPLQADDEVASIKAYDARSFILTKKGKVYAFGDCSSFLCGLVDEDGDTEGTVTTPREISFLSDKKIVNISMGNKVTIFIDDTRTGYSIGECLKGRLGIDTSVCVSYNGGKYAIKPVEITDLKGKIREISTGHEHTVVLTTDRGVYGFGYDNHGQLGIDNPEGTDLFFERPTKIPITVFASGISAERVVAGESGTCIGATDGSICCMGKSNMGELGFEPGKIVETCTRITVDSSVKYVNSMSMLDRNTFMVTSNERPDASALSGGAIAGIVIGCVIFIGGISALAYFAIKTKCWTNARSKHIKSTSKRVYTRYSHIEDEKSSLIDRADNDEVGLLKGSII